MIEVRLPWPPSILRPNRSLKQHWAKNSTAAALYKSVCAYELLDQGLPKHYSLDVPVSLTITFCPPSRRKYDRDGSLAAFKAGLDALATHLGMDDDDFEPITLRRGPVVKGGQVIVAITEE